MCGRIIDPNLRNTEVDMSQIKLDPFGGGSVHGAGVISSPPAV